MLMRQGVGTEDTRARKSTGRMHRGMLSRAIMRLEAASAEDMLLRLHHPSSQQQHLELQVSACCRKEGVTGTQHPKHRHKDPSEEVHTQHHPTVKRHCDHHQHRWHPRHRAGLRLRSTIRSRAIASRRHRSRPRSHLRLSRGRDRQASNESCSRRMRGTIANEPGTIDPLILRPSSSSSCTCIVITETRPLPGPCSALLATNTDDFVSGMCINRQQLICRERPRSIDTMALFSIEKHGPHAPFMQLVCSRWIRAAIGRRVPSVQDISPPHEPPSGPHLNVAAVCMTRNSRSHR